MDHLCHELIELNHKYFSLWTRHAVMRGDSGANAAGSPVLSLAKLLPAATVHAAAAHPSTATCVY